MDWQIHEIAAALAIGAIALLALWAVFDTTLLRDISDQEPQNRPYSLSRTQLFWWTIIIATTYAFYYGLTGDLQPLTAETLVLLGVSLGTTVVGVTLDGRQDAEAVAGDTLRHQDRKSEGILEDIMSDAQGLSIHRFQAVVFNVIFGMLFVSKFISDPDHQFPTFSEAELGLIGLSSSAYLFLKKGENNAPAARAHAGDEVPDADESRPVSG